MLHLPVKTLDTISSNLMDYKAGHRSRHGHILVSAQYLSRGGISSYTL